MNRITYACKKRFDNKCTTPNPKRRLCLKSQPVRFVDQLPVRRKKTLFSNMTENQHSACDDSFIKGDCDRRNKYYFTTDASENEIDFPRYPDIYIDPEKDENCITTVRRTCSKIKWSKPQKVSKFHKKCGEKPNFCIKVPKKHEQRKMIRSDSDIEDILMSEMEERKKFQNECYCIDRERVQSDDSKRCLKPLIVSDSRKKKYGKNTLTKARKLLDYEPESKFLKDIHSVSQPTHCTCSSCMIDRLDTAVKFTKRRGLIEKAYCEYPDPEPYKPSKLCQTNDRTYAAQGCCTENFQSENKMCMCEIIPKIRKQKTEANNTDKSYECKDAICSCNTDLRRCKTAGQNTNIRKASMDKYCTSNIHNERKDLAVGNDHDSTSQCKEKCCMCKIRSASEIRENNYFETHSIGDLCKKVSPHKCVHKFELDERLLPKPVNTDCWGQSRCNICSMPYVASKNEKKSQRDKVDKQIQIPSKPNLSDKSAFISLSSNSNTNSLLTMIDSSQRDLQRVPSSHSQNITSKNKCQMLNAQVQCFPDNADKQTSYSMCSKHTKCGSGTCIYMYAGTSVMKANPCVKTSNISLCTKLSSESRKINICNDNTIVELNTDAAFAENTILGSNQFFAKTKRAKIRPIVIPCNSLALRYQKGVF